MRNSFLDLHSIGASLTATMDFLKMEQDDLAAIERLKSAQEEWKQALYCSVSRFHSY